MTPSSRTLLLAAALLSSACGGTRKLLKQAEGYMEDARYTAAVRTYDKVLAKNPGEPRALVGIARAWLETEEPERAITPAQVAAETRVPGGDQVLVDALLENGRGADAVERAERLAQREEAGALAWRRLAEAKLAAGDLKGAVAAAEESLMRGGGAEAQSFAAWTHARRGKCDRAKSLAGRAATGAGESVVVQAEAAAVFRHCLDAAQAQGAASTARALLSRGPFDEERSAQRREAGGDLEGAIRRLSWLRTIYPEDGTYALRLGRLWADREVWGRAEYELRAALELPPYSSATVGAGVQFADRRADQLAPEQRLEAVSIIWSELAEVRQARKDISGMAEALTQRALARNDRDPAVWLQAAKAWALSPTPSQGIEVAMRAVDMAPDSYEARKVATVVLANGGIADRAIGHGRAAWAIKPGDPELALILARLHIARGELRDARQILTAGLKVAPGDPRLKDALRQLDQR